MVMERSNKKEMLYNTSYIQFRRETAIIYSSSEMARNKRNEMTQRLRIISNQNYRGKMSDTSKKLLRKKISIWFEAIEHINRSEEYVLQHKIIRPVFLTVTLSSSQFHGDKVIKSKIFKPFMRILREVYQCENYVWKAEKQQNGNIHFHIIIDKYISKELIQYQWNKCQEALGYITEFEKKYKHRNPPSCKIEVVKNWSQMGTYLEKYICKVEENSTIDGAIWKSSKKLMSLQYFEVVVDSDVNEILVESVENKSIKKIEKERYIVIIPVLITIKDLIYKKHKELYYRWLNELCDFLYNQDERTDFVLWRKERNIDSEKFYNIKNQIVVKNKKEVIQLDLLEKVKTNFGNYARFMEQ